MIENTGVGLMRGLRNVIDKPAELLAGVFSDAEAEKVRAGNAENKAATDRAYGGSTAYKVGQVGGEVLATLPVGGALGAGVRAAGVATAAPRAVALGDAIASGGLRAGGAGLATRAAGGAISGGATAGLVNPDDAGAGAAIGAAVPLAVRGLGQVGRAIGGVARPFYGAGQDRIVGNALREFAADPDAARAALASASEVIPGSVPTAAMAAGDTGLAGLSRTVQATNPTYAAELTARQTAQNQARTAALDDVAGNPGKMSLAKQARDDLTGSMRDDVLKRAGDVAAEGILTQLDGMLANPDNAGQLAQQALGQFRNRIGSLAAADGTVNARALYAIRKDINEVLGGKLQGEAGNLRYAAGQLKGVKSLIDDAIDTASRRTTLPGSREIGPLAQRVGPETGGVTSGSAQPTWRQYLETYARESQPINQMEKLSDVLRTLQTGTVDTQGNAILSAAKLNNLLKNQGADLARELTPDQMGLLRRLQADLNASQLASNAGRAVGSNTVQNLASDGLLQSVVGRGLSGSPAAQGLAGRALNMVYGGANAQIQERLAQALLDPQRAAALMQPKGPIGRSVAAAPLSLAARAAPVALTSPGR
ncbi:hypothetical protein [Variovorax sp. DXTD-1]|uniref:hypothetical protein n=1 Tax=Variovorax sp. DXTD-1 TaxID=2495592 RepID=UPI000F8938BC|nr:hypothetical protein [Variovorax sp. DXTD-1]RST54091.1 hypothetical protein EJI00_02900 [Variovorax sp. DXTD-1]